MLKRIFYALFLSGISLSSASAIELGSPFLDNAILQRGMPVPVWGWDTADANITLTFAGQKKSTTADAAGKWMLRLDPLTANVIPQDIVISNENGERITLKNILVGEVWFSSGQSNMDWQAGKSMCRDLANALQRAPDEIPLREFNADMGSSVFLRNRIESKDGWKSSKQASSFSALSLAFAYELYEELKVPIGIVRSTHGATPVETWTAYEGFVAHSDLQDIALQIRQSNPTTPESTQAYAQYYKDLVKWQMESEVLINRGGTALPRPSLPGITEQWKGGARMYHHKIAPLIPYAIRGAIWCQGESNSNDGKIYAAKMEALINGWRENWQRPELPFYFTQLQCYGEPDPDSIGFADLREAQTLFFMQAKQVGMVAQHDLNSARPTGIHYYNKLDPGKRMARWALAHQYGRKDLAYTGPIYQSHSIKDHAVRVQFEQRGPGGGLMVGSKGFQREGLKEPTAYVEPAMETPGEALQHFRLAGKDKVWHPAEAVIDGNEVVVTSPAVSQPMGVQYAYSASPIGANLYNQAGLPALPFAYFEGKQLFKEDDAEMVAREKAEAEQRYGKKTYLLPSSLFRDHGVIQRDQPVPVWGHGIPGSEITVSFAGQTKRTTVGEFEHWSITLDPMPASGTGRDILITSNKDEARTIRDVLVGDVWIMTGSRAMSGELIRLKDGEAAPEALPLVREFRIKTKARRFRTPRKVRMEIGGGKYVASWQPADFDEAGDFPSVIAYHFAAEVQQPGVPVGIVTLGAENPPLTWMSYASMQTAVGFEKERDDLNLAYPNTDSCKKAVSNYIETVKQYNREVASLLRDGKDIPAALAERAPAFPQPYYNEWVSRTETATHTYNFCISPLTPYAVSGVVWIPAEDNMTDNVRTYASSLHAYANSLPETYGQEEVLFIYAHPDAKLVEGLAPLKIEGARSHSFSEWPKSVKELAGKLGKLARRQ